MFAEASNLLRRARAPGCSEEVIGFEDVFVQPSVWRAPYNSATTRDEATQLAPRDWTQVRPLPFTRCCTSNRFGAARWL